MPDPTYALRRRVRFWRAWAIIATLLLSLSIIVGLWASTWSYWRLWIWNWTHLNDKSPRQVVPQ